MDLTRPRTFSVGSAGTLPGVVMVPGLGAPGYLLPLARSLGARTRVDVLDLPGWRWGRARSCAPTLVGIADAVEQWLRATGRRDVVLVGHATGAQSVARVVPRTPELVAGTVLAGPTFTPAARGPLRLLVRAARTMTREVPGELAAVLPSYLHSAGFPLLGPLRNALGDPLEEVAADSPVPLLFLSGRGNEVAASCT